jgi:hypothetical protein
MKPDPLWSLLLVLVPLLLGWWRQDAIRAWWRRKGLRVSILKAVHCRGGQMINRASLPSGLDSEPSQFLLCAVRLRNRGSNSLSAESWCCQVGGHTCELTRVLESGRVSKQLPHDIEPESTRDYVLQFRLEPSVDPSLLLHGTLALEHTFGESRCAAFTATRDPDCPFDKTTYFEAGPPRPRSW